ncbi:PREDICTED: F-box/WD repeat-containing protein 4-like isoform X2 [Priapulus caudatus]|uniref:F-box/WD repeat-containing protein 4-like isoform X2 n=1 Tax=Priapulus caudatus TaxID=37621 RepID=A0ABM1F034_PRICU|nr:PREDICTED: F-box/WD repeat-containing protein 4-like isoform X2 [Priapulus caudatus]
MTSSRFLGHQERLSGRLFLYVMTHTLPASPWFGGLQYLADDVLFLIFEWCDVTTLGRLSQVCRRFTRLLNNDNVWSKLTKCSLMTWHGSRLHSGRYYISAKERCMISENWLRGKRKEIRLVKYAFRQLPWLQATYDRLWYSSGSTIHCTERRPDGCIVKRPLMVLQGHHDDVCRFIYADSYIISGGSDKSLCVWKSDSGRRILRVTNSHDSSVNCVGFSSDVIVSGSRDSTVKLWSLVSGRLQRTFTLEDRVWSIAGNSKARTFACGTAGINTAPLQVWDVESGSLLASLGVAPGYRRGAGVLDIVYDEPRTIVSCGYDSCVCVFDTRTNACVLKLGDPHDSTVYCISTDHNYGIVSGTARHALVRLWDQRSGHSVQMYYVSGCNSPVYSLVAELSCCYVALDQSITMLDFTVR